MGRTDCTVVFSSLTFAACFLPSVFCLYFLSKNPRWRNGVLLVFSILFYSWGEPRFLLLMLLSIGINYLSALGIAGSARPAVRKLCMLLGVMTSLGLLIWFKYSAFAVNSLSGLLGLGDVMQPKTLPIGISFYTFQVLTYTIDVYRGKCPVQKNLFRLALYISFFPQLIAGPIVNYSYIQPQLEKRDISHEDVYLGLRRFIIGLSKKLLLANLCGEITDLLGGGSSMLGAWLSAIAFTLQIYFDFSGYSDMAIGMGRCFGFRFMENFDHPYVSLSVSEFWRRWHISLGAFFREYVYIPLGGSRVNKARLALNLLVVWALTGLWHGASWNFLVWGLYYCILLIIEKLTGVSEKLPRAIRFAGTLLLVIFGWVIFYNESLTQGLGQISRMLCFGTEHLSDGVAVYCLKRYLGVLLISVAACLPWTRLRKCFACRNKKLFAAAEGIVLTALLVLCYLSLAGSSYNPFLYFRF